MPTVQARKLSLRKAKFFRVEVPQLGRGRVGVECRQPGSRIHALYQQLLLLLLISLQSQVWACSDQKKNSCVFCSLSPRKPSMVFYRQPLLNHFNTESPH